MISRLGPEWLAPAEQARPLRACRGRDDFQAVHARWSLSRPLYVAGTTDRGPLAGDTSAAAKRVLDNIKRSVEAGGLTMDDLVWVQVFSADLADYAAFNAVYRTYFKGPMPARAYLGVDHLLGGAKFEVMGIAVKR
ncbi:MAG: Endoribonuclease [Phenylobacterium sp.]|nr:Endoribonuclease [Phenylobacterium sp.]